MPAIAAVGPAGWGRSSGVQVERASAALVRDATGFAIGGVPPVGHTTPLPTAIDACLGRFTTLYAAAGHPYVVFPTSLAELARLTSGTVSEAIAEP